MIKKLYQKDGIVYIDYSKDHKINEIEKNSFIIKELNENKSISKKEILKKYYISKGFTY